MQRIAESTKRTILKHLRRMAWEDYKRRQLKPRQEQAAATLRPDHD
ncbi:hypothetical protein ACWEQC_06835 [Streptomyces shenzhenensis]